MLLLTWFLSGVPALADTGDSDPVRVELSQTVLEQQTKYSINYIYAVGPEGLHEGDLLWIRDPVFHGMNWTLWGKPQLDPGVCDRVQADPRTKSDGVVSVSSSGDATLGIERVGPDGVATTEHDVHLEFFTQVRVDSGSLEEGDHIRVTYGDTSINPICGHESPGRAYQDVAWPAYEKLDGAEDFTLVEPVPTFTVTHDDTLSLIRVRAPSTVVVGQAFTLMVAPLDAFGNAIVDHEGSFTIEAQFGGASHTFTSPHAGFWDQALTIDTPGVYRVGVSGGGLDGRSNPILVLEQAPERFLYWGDIHVHHGHDHVDADGQWVEENLVYARDIARLDFASESQKALPTEIDGEVLWQTLQRGCEQYSEDGRFIVLLGFEWMGTYGGGPDLNYHHNVYWDSCQGPIGDHEHNVLLAGEDGLYQWVRDAELASGIRGLMIAHGSRFTGYDWDSQDNSLRRLVEVYSEWGSSIDPPDEDASVQTGLAAGNRFGFTAASDNHEGWMGNTDAEKAIDPGLGAVWAPALTRADIWQAHYDRHTYATTGHRSILSFYAQDGAQVLQGSEYVAEQPTFHWAYYGDGPVSELNIRGLALQVGAVQETLHSASFQADTLDVVGEFAWSGWSGGDYAVWMEVKHSDGEMAWSSPIYLSSNCEGESVSDPAGRCDPVDTAGPVDTGAGDTGPADTGPADTQAPGDSGADDSGTRDTGDTKQDPPCGCSHSPRTAWLGLLVLPLWVRSRRLSWRLLPTHEGSSRGTIHIPTEIDSQPLLRSASQ